MGYHEENIVCRFRGCTFLSRQADLPMLWDPYRKCFDKEYFDVRVMIPKYLCIKDKFLSNLTYVNHFYMDYLGQSRYVGILEYVYEGSPSIYR